MNIKEIVNEQEIFKVLEETANPTKQQISTVLDKASLKKGLSLKDAGILVNAVGTELTEDIFKCASKIKNDIYGERLVFFAPLYVSNYCVNDCDYCAFHKKNKQPRKKLSLDEVKQQVEVLIRMGHKRLLLEFGEDPVNNTIDYVIDVIKTVYNTKVGNGEIRRVNVNVSATNAEDYKKLKEVGIGTYQLFQETYNRETYEKYHNGPKADYERQITAHDRAFAAGVDDVGVGVLFGLYDWRFEVLALLSHSKYLDKKYGVGPHTISVPRLKPASTVNMDSKYEVSDNEFLLVIAILRLAVPYTGMIISTRENAQIRRKAFKIGISQTSAASRTYPGAYGDGNKSGQFELSDHRSVSDVIKDVLEQGLMPSYCTACYRQGRTGHTFMDLAKPGDIHNLCRPNAILTFKEYLEDYATEEVRKVGTGIIEQTIKEISNESLRAETEKRITEIEAGKRDLFF